MIFKQETIKSWFTGVGSSINNEVVQPFQNANSIISKYNLAIQHNSLTQQGWQRLLAQSDDSLKAYLTSIKGTTASMSGYNVSLQGNITGFTKITKAMQQYNALGTTSQKEQQAFATAVGATNTKLGSYLTGLNGAKASHSGYGLSLIASTAKTIGLTVATTALNATLTMGISLIVSGLISAFVSWIHKSEEITEKAQEAADKINSINNSLKSNTETVENAKKRYAELAQEVENLGKITQSQGTLNNEEYEEFLDLSNQLAGIFPFLTKNYDENGNAILDLSGDVNTIIGSLDSLIQKEKELANQKIMEEFPDVFKGWNQDLSDAEQKVKSAKTEFNKINNAYQQLSNGTTSQAFDLQRNGWFTNENGEKVTISMNEYISSLEALGLKYEETQLKVKNQFGGDTLSGYLIEATGDIDTAFTSKLEAAREDLHYAQQQLEGQTSSINQYLNTWLQGEFSYIQIEDRGLQTAIQDMLFNFDWDNIPEDKRGDWNYVSEYLRRNILFEINKVQDDPVISKAISEVFTNTELTPDEKSNYLQQIRDFFGEKSAVVISLKPQIEETETLQKQYDKAIEDTKKKFDGYDPTAFFKEHSINTQEEIDAWQEIAQGARDAADAEKEYIQGSTLNENPISLPTSKTLSDLKDLNAELDNLGNAMANLDSKGNFDLGNLDSIADYFLNLNLEAVSYDTEAVNNALKSLGDENASVKEQADAVNTLADQYLKTSHILDHLNEENAKLMKFQLERMGISNAEKIIDATLNGILQTQAELEATLAQYKSIVTGETLTLNTVTAQEIQNLFEEGKITSNTATQMALMAIKKQLVNNNTLDASADINNLISLCQTLGATTTALETYNRVKNGANGMPSDVVESYRKQAEQELQNAIKTGENAVNAIYKKVPTVEYDGGSAIADLLKDTGNAAAQAQDTYEELFDFFERRVDVLNDALELLNANLENVVGSNAKNLLIDAQIGINKESASNYTDALLMYQQKAVEALSKVPEDLRQITVDGSVSMTNFIGSENEEIVNAIKDYQKWSDKVSDCQQELAKLKETLRQLELDKFNNIIEDFTNQFDISTNAQSLINKQIDLFEEAGELIGKGFYEGLIKESKGQLSILEQEKQALVNELNAGLAAGTIEAGTDEWLEMVSALNDVDGSILDCKKDIEGFNNSIQKLHWDIIDRIQDNFSDLSDEISNLVGLINDADVSDKEGLWTPEGLTQLGLYAQEYERAVYSSQMYADEIEKLNQAYMEGGYSATEYADKLSDLKKAQWNEINASEEAKKAIIDLNEARIDIMVKGIEEEIDAMKELTDAKIKALDAEKDLNDYRNSLTEKNKSITDLERQIAAMQNDTTAASVAKRKKLEEQLAEAKRELADFEYEHSIEVQKETLNQQYEDFETEKNNEITALQNTLTQQETLIANSFETVKQNAATIGNEISLIASNHGIKISESLTTAWQSGNDAIASYGMTLSTGESQFVISLSNMVMSTYSLQEQADMTASSLANMYNTNSSKLQSDLVNSYYCIANVNAATQALQTSLISTLDRGYDVSSLVNQIDSVGNSAANAADKVNALMNALAASNNATHQKSLGQSYQNTGTRVAPTFTNTHTAQAFNQSWIPSNFQLNLHKYANGGIVTKDENNPLNNIAKSIGEDTLIAAKDGEGILTPVQTTEFMKLTANMEAFNSIMPKPLANSALNNIFAIQKAQPNVQIHYDNLVQVQGDVNNSNIRQMESIVNNAVDRQFNQFNSELYKRGVR